MYNKKKNNNNNSALVSFLTDFKPFSVVVLTTRHWTALLPLNFLSFLVGDPFDYSPLTRVREK